MAGRPYQQGLGYFSFDVDFFDDPKVDELNELFPDAGPVFYAKLLCYIYSQGNHILWNKTNIRLFKNRFRISVENINKMLPHVFDLDLMSKRLFEKYGVLSSSSLQARYLVISYKLRRTKVIFIEPYMLIKPNDFQLTNYHIEIHDKEGELISIHYWYSKESKQGKKTGKSKEAQNPTFTTTDLRAYVKIPYESRDDKFKDLYTKEQYDTYIQFNKIVDERFEHIRTSKLQMDFREWISLVHEMDPTGTELNDGLKKMLSLGLKPDMSVYRRLEDCITMIRKTPYVPQLPAAGPQPDEPDISDAAVYYRDEPFEKEILLFFYGEKWSNFHQSLVLLVQFCTTKYNEGQLDFFREQFSYYKQVKADGLFKHNFNNFLGDQAERFENGQWNKENWKQKLAEKPKTNKNGTGKTDRSGNKKDHGII